MTKMSLDQIHDQIKPLTQWQHTQKDGVDTLVLTHTFDDFNTAFGVMTQIALHAERADHHPTFTNTYADLKVELSTHDAGGITQKDMDMAQFISRLITH